jgi:hypothetical protein
VKRGGHQGISPAKCAGTTSGGGSHPGSARAGVLCWRFFTVRDGGDTAERRGLKAQLKGTFQN